MPNIAGLSGDFMAHFDSDRLDMPGDSKRPIVPDLLPQGRGMSSNPFGRADGEFVGWKNKGRDGGRREESRWGSGVCRCRVWGTIMDKNMFFGIKDR